MIIKFLNFSKKYFFAILVLSLVFVWSSQYWTTEIVYHDEDFRDVRSGFPLGYSSADFVRTNASADMGDIFPQRMNRLSYPEYVHPETIWRLFFLSMAIMQLVFSALFFAVHSVFPKPQNILIGLLFFIVATFIYIFGTSLLAGGEVPIRVSPETSVPIGVLSGVRNPAPSELSQENTPMTFEEVLRETPEKKISVEASFVRGISLSETISATQNAPFTVTGFKHRAGESNGGCGAGNGETVEQVLQSCFRDHSLFLGRRIEMEKQSLLTVTDPGLRNALIAHIKVAEKENELRITGMGLHGRALDLQNFKDANSFVGSMTLVILGEQPMMMSLPGSSTAPSFPVNIGAPKPSPAPLEASPLR